MLSKEKEVRSTVSLIRWSIMYSTTGAFLVTQSHMLLEREEGLFLSFSAFPSILKAIKRYRFM